MSPEASPYIPWRVDSMRAFNAEWRDRAALTSDLDAELRETIARRTDPERAADYRRQCPVAGASVEDYFLRAVSLPSGTRLLVGIHFYGGDVTRPFVGVAAQTQSLTVDQMRDAGPLLCAEFAVFGTTKTWWWSDARRSDTEGKIGVTNDQRLLVGQLAAIRGLPVPQSTVEVALRPDSDGASYETYSTIFDRYLEAHPMWRGRLERTDGDTYRQCAAEGGLHVVEHDGRIAGLLAACRGNVRGIRGWQMIEEILDDQLRGRGLAASIQRRFLDALDRSAAPLIIGTIDDANAASWRTALRVGRKDVGGWVFVESA